MSGKRPSLRLPPTARQAPQERIPGDDNRPAVTVGLELEFQVSSVASIQRFPLSEDSKKRWLGSKDVNSVAVWTADFLILMCECFQKAGIPVIASKNDTAAATSEDKNKPATDNLAGKQRSWTLTVDDTIKAEDPWLGLELTSAPFFADDDSLPQQLEKICSWITGNCIARVTDKCATHVHTGVREKPAETVPLFSLLYFKKFATVLWLTEEILASSHAKHRWSNGPYCLPLTRYSQLTQSSATTNQASAEMITYTPPEIHGNAALQNIWQTKTITDLRSLLEIPPQRRISGHEDERGWVGFRGVSGKDWSDHPVASLPRSRQTFEFRGMEGCLDPKRIMSWLRVCVGVATIATSGDERFRGIVSDLTSLEKFNSEKRFSRLKQILGLN